jgi:hypothetical protein
MDHFTTLPQEIRDQIYGLLLVRPRAICITSPKAKPAYIANFFPTEFTSITLVSRKIHNETASIFYSLNIFKVGNGQWPQPNLSGFQALVLHIPARHLSLIRKVRFVFWVFGRTKSTPGDTVWVPKSIYNKCVETHLENVLRRLEETDVELDVLSLRIRVLGGYFMTPRYIRYSWKDLDIETKQFVEMLLQIGAEKKFQLDELARFAGDDVEKVEKFEEKALSNKSGPPHSLMLVLNIRTSWQKPGLFEDRRTMSVEGCLQAGRGETDLSGLPYFLDLLTSLVACNVDSYC